MPKQDTELISNNLRNLYASIGADKTAAVFNKDDEQVVAILKGHSKKVNRVIYHPNGENNVITASYDGTIRIWDVPTSQVQIHNLLHKVQVFVIFLLSLIITLIILCCRP